MKKPKHMEQAIFFPRAFRNEIDLWRWHYRLLFRTIFHSSSNIPIIQDIIHLWTVDFRANTRKNSHDEVYELNENKPIVVSKLTKLVRINSSKTWNQHCAERKLVSGPFVKLFILDLFSTQPSQPLGSLSYPAPCSTILSPSTLIKPGNSTKCILGGPFK